MKAVRYHEYGDPSVLRVEEIDRPDPGAGQLLVQVAATTFNAVDATMRAGFLQRDIPLRLPHTPGLDVAGTVAALGAGVTGFAPGDAVIGFLPMAEDGAAAEFVLAPADTLTAAPTGSPLAEAAALPSAALTAWQALFEHADLRAGQRLLINGAGGGVGGFATQFAKGAGAYVIATASPRSAAAVDAVLNLVRGSEQDMATLVGLVRPGGVLVTTASPARDDTARGVRAIAMFVRSDTGQLAAIVARVDSGAVRVDISETYPLAAIARVHEQGEAGEIRGKALILPDA